MERLAVNIYTKKDPARLAFKEKDTLLLAYRRASIRSNENIFTPSKNIAKRPRIIFPRRSAPKEINIFIDK